MRNTRPSLRIVVAASASGALAVSMLTVAAAPGLGAEPTATPAGKVRGAEAKPLASPYVDEPSVAVAVTSATNRKSGKKGHKKRHQSKVAVKGSTLTVTIGGVSRAVVQSRQGTAGVLRGNVLGTWNQLGADPTGVVSGWTDKGDRVSAPVVFKGATYQSAKRKLVVTATLPDGKIDPLSAKYVPWVSQAKSAMPAGKYRQLGIVGFPRSSRTFKWSAAGKGTAKFSRSRFTVRLAMDTTARKSGAGVQRGGQVASVQWATLAQQWAKFAGKGGIAPRLVVDTATKKRSAVAVLAPETVSVSGNTLVIAGSVPARTPGGKRAVPSAKNDKMAVTLETAGVGVDRRYVVITGDSIASGEGASYAGTYINPTLGVTPTQPTGRGQVYSWLLAKQGSGAVEVPDPDGSVARAMVEFCKKIDLACTKAALDADGKVVYQRDPGKVYEQGSWEKADAGEACHRSKTAPGTWLARYYKTQVGLDVESINLACSGATTDNILDTPFKGERPQVEDLKALADWLPVTHVVNTVGANDLGFTQIATECFFAPINTLLPGGLSGGLTADALLASFVNIFDDVAAKPDGTLVAINPKFKVESLCSTKNRGAVEAKLQRVRLRVADVLRALHEAAPDSELVQTNYPSLVTSQTNTYWPRQEWYEATRPGFLLQGRLLGGSYWDKKQDCPEALQRPTGKEWAFLDWCQASPEVRKAAPTHLELLIRRATSADGQTKFPEPPSSTSDVWPGGVLPAGKPNPDMVQGMVEGNEWNKLIMDNYYKFSTSSPTVAKAHIADETAFGGILQTFLFEQRPVIELIAYGALLFGPDTDWAEEEVIAELDKATDDAVKDVDPDGEFITAVDMSQVFNGREFGGKYTGHLETPSQVVLGYESDQLGATWDTASPTKSRAQFVTTIFAGQELPYLCPGGATGFDSVAGATKPRCIGDFQENMHPNWRGQAAQGQCIVAVVARAFGQGGNACVRSVGADNGAQELTYPTEGTIDSANDAGVAPVLFSLVDGDDSLCLTGIDDARKASERGQHLNCTSKVAADPTWDAERWDAGKVTDGDGSKVTWR